MGVGDFLVYRNRGEITLQEKCRSGKWLHHFFSGLYNTCMPWETLLKVREHKGDKNFYTISSCHVLVFMVRSHNNVASTMKMV